MPDDNELKAKITVNIDQAKEKFAEITAVAQDSAKKISSSEETITSAVKTRPVYPLERDPSSGRFLPAKRVPVEESVAPAQPPVDWSNVATRPRDAQGRWTSTPAVIPVNADTTQADRQIAISKAKAFTPPATIIEPSTGARRSEADVLAGMKALESQYQIARSRTQANAIVVDANTAPAKTKIESLRSEESKPIKIPTETASASTSATTAGETNSQLSERAALIAKLREEQTSLAQATNTRAEAEDMLLRSADAGNEQAQQIIDGYRQEEAEAQNRVNQVKTEIDAYDKAAAQKKKAADTGIAAANDGADGQKKASQKIGEATASEQAAYARLVKAQTEYAATQRVVKEMEEGFAKGTIEQSQRAINDYAVAMQEASVAAKELDQAEAAVNGRSLDGWRVNQQLGYSIFQARSAMMGLGQILGIQIPYYIDQYLTRLPALGRALTAAFSTVAVIGVIQELPVLINKVRELTDAYYGFGEAARTAYEAAKKANADELHQIAQSQIKQADFAVIGKEGPAKIKAEQDTSRARQLIEVREMNAAQTRLNDLLAAEVAINERRRRDVEKTRPDITGITGTFQLGKTAAEKYGLKDIPELKALGIDSEKELKQQIEKASEDLKKSTDAVKSETGRIDTNPKSPTFGQKVGGKQQEIQVEGAVEKNTEERTQTAASLEATKTVALAKIRAIEDVAHAQHAAGLITIAEDEAATRKGINDRLKAELTFISGKEALARRTEKQTGAPAGPQIASLEAQRTAAQKEANAKLEDLDIKSKKGKEDREDSFARVQIEATQRMTDAKVAIEQESAQRTYEIAKLRGENVLSAANTETAALIAAENKRYEAAKTADEKKIELLKHDEEKNRDEISRMQHELETKEVEHQGHLNSIREQGTQKALSDLVEFYQREESLASAHANRMLEAENVTSEHKYEKGSISFKGMIADQRAALDQWYQEQSASIDAQMRAAEQAYGKNSTQYRESLGQREQIDLEYQRKKQALQDKELQGWRQFVNQESTILTTGINGWIQGTESFRVAMARMWGQMVMTAIQAIERIAAQWIAKHILMAAVAKALKALGLYHPDDDGSKEQQKAAAKVAANETQASSDAGLAAAEEFVYAIADSGGDVWYAAEQAAIAYGIGSGYAALTAFDHGGIQKETGLALVHQDEGVLTRPATRMLQSVISLNESGALGNPYIGVNPDLAGAVSPIATAVNPTVSNSSNTFNAGDTHIHGATDPERIARMASDLTMARVKQFHRSNGVMR